MRNPQQNRRKNPGSHFAFCTTRAALKFCVEPGINDYGLPDGNWLGSTLKSNFKGQDKTRKLKRIDATFSQPHLANTASNHILVCSVAQTKGVNLDVRFLSLQFVLIG